MLSTTVPITIKLRRGGVDTYIHKDKRIESGEPFELMKGNKLVLATSDKLIVSSKLFSPRVSLRTHLSIIDQRHLEIGLADR